MPGSDRWTTEADLVARLRRRWDRGEWLSLLARGEPFEPIRLPLATPTPRDLESDFGAVLDWARSWRDIAPARLRIEYKRIGGRRIGSNEIPCRAFVDSLDQLCTLLRTGADVERFLASATLAAETDPRLIDWIACHPVKVLELGENWRRALAAVRWIRDCADPGSMFLRQIDAPGVDTKFIESHRKVIAGMLDTVLHEQRINPMFGPAAFASRYGFKTKPERVRFRLLGGLTIGGLTDLQVRIDEFSLPAGIKKVVIVENETTFLAFPDFERSMVVLGGGYAVAIVARLADLADCQVLYWGDLDTHGFAILHRLRSHLPMVTSMLMDESTLLQHRAHWGCEPDPAKGSLNQLTPAEDAVYQGLVEGRWGKSLRLEQEHIRFSHVAAALANYNEAGSCLGTSFRFLPLSARLM
jgi:hypothetical protein